MELDNKWPQSVVSICLQRGQTSVGSIHWRWLLKTSSPSTSISSLVMNSVGCGPLAFSGIPTTRIFCCLISTFYYINSLVSSKTGQQRPRNRMWRIPFLDLRSWRTICKSLDREQFSCSWGLLWRQTDWSLFQSSNIDELTDILCNSIFFSWDSVISTRY